MQLHRVHDLSPILGNGSCALEMEVVAGGDLSQHLDAARRRPEQRLPAAAVLRFSRQLLQALVYLRDEMKWLHGDIKPQNMLLQCHPLPADGSAIDYSDAEIKLADFGLAKVMDQENSSASFMLSNASTKAGVVIAALAPATQPAQPFVPSNLLPNKMRGNVGHMSNVAGLAGLHGSEAEPASETFKTMV